jgi:hypothetical protein
LAKLGKGDPSVNGTKESNNQGWSKSKMFCNCQLLLKTKWALILVIKSQATTLRKTL